jgi:hypothetical protein
MHKRHCVFFYARGSRWSRKRVILCSGAWLRSFSGRFLKNHRPKRRFVCIYLISSVVNFRTSLGWFFVFSIRPDDALTNCGKLGVRLEMNACVRIFFVGPRRRVTDLSYSSVRLHWEVAPQVINGSAPCTCSFLGFCVSISFGAPRPGGRAASFIHLDKWENTRLMKGDRYMDINK